MTPHEAWTAALAELKRLAEHMHNASNAYEYTARGAAVVAAIRALPPPPNLAEPRR